MSARLLAAGLLLPSKIARRLDKNVLSVPFATKGQYSLTNRLYCKSGKASDQQQPTCPDSGFGEKTQAISNWDKKILLWSGRFKKAEDIPATVTPEMLNTARSKMRIKTGIVMILLTLLSCLYAAILGRKDIKEHKSLTSWNLEKKAQWKEETARSDIAKP